MWSFVTRALHQILLGSSNQGIWDGKSCSTHGRGEKCIPNFGWKT